MTIFALIKNGTVFNTIVASQDFITNNFNRLIDYSGDPIDAAIDITSIDVSIGYSYDGTNFYPPIEED